MWFEHRIGYRGQFCCTNEICTAGNRLSKERVARGAGCQLNRVVRGARSMIVKGVDSQRIGLSGEQDVRLEGMSEEWTEGMVKERKDARM